MSVQNELVLRLSVRPGMLTVIVQRANNLDAKDDNGFSDPFVTLEFQKKKKKTKIIKKNLNPTWGEQFEFGFAMNSSPLLSVAVMDWDKVGSNDFIGEEYIDVTHQKMEVDLSIPLKPKGKGTKAVQSYGLAHQQGLRVTQSAPATGGSFDKYQTKTAPPGSSAYSTPNVRGLGKGKEEKKDDAEGDDDQTIFVAFRVVLTDPRYIRLCKKLDPRFRSKNMLKTLVDPSSIPWVGHAVRANRSVRGEKNRHLLKQVNKGQDDESLDSTYAVLEKNMKTECCTRHLTLGMGVAFQAMPVSALLPGVGDAAAASASGIAATGIAAVLAPGMEVAGTAGVVVTTATVQAATETGIEVATQGGRVVAEAVIDEVAENVVEESVVATTDKRGGKKLNKDQQIDQVNATFTKTKILLLYLGAPQVLSDTLYSRWESHRLVLKKLYGAQPDDDLAQMEGSDELKQAIKEIQDNPNGVFNVEELGISPLWLLWKIYECWGTIYFDYLHEKKHTFNKKKFLEEKRARERYQDEQYLKNLCLQDYPGIRKVLKSEKDLCVDMLMDCYKGHPHMFGMVGSKEEKTDDHMRFYWGNVFDYFLKEYEIWAFEDMEDFSLQAIALVEPPKASPPNLPDWMGKRDTIRSLKQLGKKRSEAIQAELKQQYAYRKSNIGRGGGIQVIHYVANITEDLGEGTPLHQLVEIMLHTLNKTKPKYVQEYHKAQKWQSFFMSCGMQRRDKTDPNLRVLWKEPDVTEDEVKAMELLRNAVKNELVIEIEVVGPKRKPNELKVKLVRCNNLDALDKSGTSDPYMVLTFQGKEEKTKIQAKELNPVWNESYTWKISNLRKKFNLKIECYDDNKYARPELIGMEKLNILTQKTGKLSIPLKPKKSFKQAEKGRGRKGEKFEKADETLTSQSSLPSQASWGHY